MAYTINKTSGTVLANVADGTIDSSTADLTLIGKNYSGYGDALNENFVKLLENFSNTTAPSSPLAGQLWWDSTNNLLKVYTGSTFKTVSSSTASPFRSTSTVTVTNVCHMSNRLKGSRNKSKYAQHHFEISNLAFNK